MAAATFDSLHYARQLEAAGMLHEQPEVVAKGLTAMVVHNVDSLEDRLEVRFERIDSRFSRIYLMFGITMVAVTIPMLQKLFG